MRTTVFFIILLSTCISSCRFHKPMFLNQLNTFSVTNSVSNTTDSTTNYNFFRPTLHGYKGWYSVVETTDSNGIVIKYKTTKKNYLARDGQAKSWTKFYFYQNGIKIQKKRTITKNQGKRGRKILLDKSTFYNEFGKKIKSSNNVK